MDATNTVDTMPPLFTDQADFDAFLARHDANHPPEVDVNTYSGDAYLGIDAGSTTTKLTLIAPDGGLLYTYYQSNRGDPVAVVLDQLKKIYALCGSRIVIRGSAVTGYGEDLIKNAFGCDLGLVETMAHYNAAAALSARRGLHHRHRRPGHEVLQDPQRRGGLHHAQRGLLLRLRLLHRDLRPGSGLRRSRSSPGWACSPSIRWTWAPGALCS